MAILGLGMEGLALFEFLSDKVAKISICDKNTESDLIAKAEPDVIEKIKSILKNDDVEKILGEKYLDDLSSFDIVFRSPGVYFRDPKLIKAKSQGVVVSSQMKLFFDLCPCQIIGVTGTKGKGTVSSLIYGILAKNFEFLISNAKSNPNDQNPNEKNGNDTNSQLLTLNSQPNVYLAGNIGKPAITLIPKLKKSDIVVLELSNFQLADLDKSPHIAVLTNLGVDHLDYHETLEEYQATKENIVRFQGERDYAVLNHDSTFDKEFLSRIKSVKKYFAYDNSFVDCEIVTKKDHNSVVLDPSDRQIEIVAEDEIRLVGKHNLANIAAASLVADILDIDPEVIRESTKEFSGLPHRLELVAEVDGVKYIDDSFATNPSPTIAAVEAFRGKKILILGGSPKGADFSELSEIVAKSNVSGVVLIGTEAEKIRTALNEAKYSGVMVGGGKTMDKIVEAAKELAESGDVVIFSPACASFDMFKNYKERGDKFKAAVLNLS